MARLIYQGEDARRMADYAGCDEEVITASCAQPSRPVMHSIDARATA